MKSPVWHRFIVSFWVITTAHEMRAAADPNPTAPKMIYVSPAGNDHATGTSLAEALKTSKAAALKAEPGTIIRFDAGTYQPFKIDGKKGAIGQTIVIETVPGKEQQVVFSTGQQEAGIAISIENCSYVAIRNLKVTNSQKGIDIVSCSNCIIQNNVIEDLGQEAIHVGRAHGNGAGPKEFNGPPSEQVQVIGNSVRGTGKWKAEFGEGIYIGTGAFLGDDTHHILIAGNTLTDISAEGVELKPGTHDITVRGNSISNTHHEYNAAITVSVEGNAESDGNFLIEDNLIWDIKKLKYGVAGIGIGHGNTVIRNNIIWSVEGGVGIRLYETFAEPHSLSVLIESNTIWCQGPDKNIVLYGGSGGGSPSGLKPKVKVKGTYTMDGSADSHAARPGTFVGPLTSDADSGKGPGSGFQSKGRGQWGANFAKIGLLLHK